MVTTRRWWDSKLLRFGLLTVVMSSAWMLRQTQGHLVLEMYQVVSRPLQMLQTGPSPEERLNDARFLELQARIADLENQNQKLKNLLGYVEKAPLSSRPILARVVGRSADHWWQQVTLNRGSNAGIKEGFIVKTDGGLVGLIENVTPNTSRVLLISDLKSQVGVTINRSSAKGVLRGDSSAEAVLEFYEKVPNVRVGDLISTSTYSQKFPAGVPVGRVKSVNLKQSPASVAQVELLPPILSLDWVAVYPAPAGD
ncbi:rod shape-determining protein MreC [Nodularia sphaerocarpa]|uniref:rod shape-determining protein MreC n=1 Tax=Nodularia sphaerocarpa TaxID=137816 RepID=UPI001EFB9EC1|nr:rod shape-determining protein MreC [Nodularia sphaerocarpa]MDB9371902.1 rod shape-determining protein MreC [Nodularia sphaerocarpa CS-585]MDB9380603.1 rod shape-determining protein MreC [Nodularia sphaerocarpa CS-585A2]ULP70721.1 Cell shape-determining protein MreC [Nodularia sphaerocarpa UHCC 0038]